MYKIHFLACVVLASLTSFASCTKSVDQSGNGEVSGPSIECVAPSDSKTYVDGVSVKWSKDDTVYVTRKDLSEKRVYTLIEGEGSIYGKFGAAEGYDGFPAGTDVYVFTKTLKGGDYVHSDGNWYFCISASQALDCNSSQAEDNIIPIPMMSEGTIGDDGFNFVHLASVIRLNVTNASSAPLTIQSIQLTSADQELGGLCSVNPISREVSLSDGADINATGGVELSVGETKVFDYVALSGSFQDFSAVISTSNGRYVFKKASLTMVKGSRYSFSTPLSEQTKEAKYKISIDGADEVDFRPLVGFKKMPAKSIKIRSVADEPTSESEWNAIVDCINGVTDTISVDLKGMTGLMNVSGNFKSLKYGLHSDKVTDLYLPDNVTAITSYSMFINSPNMRLHISPSINYIIYVQFNGSNSYVNGSCGFYVDEDNKNFSSIDGVLYNKAGTTLCQMPTYKDSTVIVVKEGVTRVLTNALSNNHIVETIVLPESLTTIDGSNMSSGLPKLHTIICQAPNVPAYTGTPKGAPSGKIMIDTGDPDTDISSKAAYQAAWSSHLGNFQVVTRAEYIPPTGSTTGSLTGFGSNSDYNTDLW